MRKPVPNYMSSLLPENITVSNRRKFPMLKKVLLTEKKVALIIFEDWKLTRKQQSLSQIFKDRSMTQECRKSRTISVSVSVLINEHKSNGIRRKWCLPREVFKRIQRWESVSRHPTKTTFHFDMRSFGKEGTCFCLQKAQQQRDILCLQYKKACAAKACPKQLPRIRPYG